MSKCQLFVNGHRRPRRNEHRKSSATMGRRQSLDAQFYCSESRRMSDWTKASLEVKVSVDEIDWMRVRDVLDMARLMIY